MRWHQNLQFWETIRNVERAPWVKYHNIIGLMEESKVLRAATTGTDGIVGQESAHADEAVSEIVVRAPHTKVHQHPRAILEVRRILLQHLNEVRANQQPATVDRIQLTSAHGNLVE